MSNHSFCAREVLSVHLVSWARYRRREPPDARYALRGRLRAHQALARLTAWGAGQRQAAYRASPRAWEWFQWQGLLTAAGTAIAVSVGYAAYYLVTQGD
jgi:hypothetical protein